MNNLSSTQYFSLSKFISLVFPGYSWIYTKIEWIHFCDCLSPFAIALLSLSFGAGGSSRMYVSFLECMLLVLGFWVHVSSNSMSTLKEGVNSLK